MRKAYTRVRLFFDHFQHNLRPVMNHFRLYPPHIVPFVTYFPYVLAKTSYFFAFCETFSRTRPRRQIHVLNKRPSGSPQVPVRRRRLVIGLVVLVVLLLRLDDCGRVPALLLPEQLLGHALVVHLHLRHHIAGHEARGRAGLAPVEAVRVLVAEDLDQLALPALGGGKKDGVI